ncbi:hypothetical protein QL285_010385 [Trifolium repens]|nr:hypothetical protein QL285_010385 [Trifolium repens]
MWRKSETEDGLERLREKAGALIFGWSCFDFWLELRFNKSRRKGLWNFAILDFKDLSLKLLKEKGFEFEG